MNDGYLDIQVNGYGGVDFHRENLELADLQRCCELLRADGAGGIFATIITDLPDRMERCLARLVELRAADPQIAAMIVGIHIEGPFLSPEDGYRGAHPLDAICKADRKIMERLLAAAGGLTRLVTLAPEQDPDFELTRYLHGQGITVSAGHTNASRSQLEEAITNGLSMFTHLGNGCPGVLPRHDNIIQRALALRDHLRLCFIADGVHIPFFALKNYLELAGFERSIVTTDAMAAAGLGAGRFTIGRWEVDVGEDCAAWAPDKSHLIGSALCMSKAQQNLADHLGLDASAVAALTRSNPREAFGL